MLANTLKALLLIASLLVMETALSGNSFNDQGFVTGSLTADGGGNRFAGAKPEGDDQPDALTFEPYTHNSGVKPATPFVAPVQAICHRIASGHPIRGPPSHLML